MRVFLISLIAGGLLMSCSNCSKERTSFPELKKADELFEKGTFEAALKEYQAVEAAAKDPQLKWRAFYRATECMSHLYRYGEAAQKLLDTPVPEEMPLRARILLLRAEILQNFVMQYSTIQSGDVLDGGGGKEVFRKTRGEVEAEVRKAYLELWKLREDLVGMDIENEGYFLDIGGADLGAYPTMFDVVVFSWTEFIIRMTNQLTEKTVWPDGEQILVDSFAKPLNPDDPPGLLAAELMEEASRFETDDRKEAAERWKVKRLVLLGRGVFKFKDPKAAGVKASGLLLQWFESFDEKGARAEAGYEAASLLSSAEEYVKAVEVCRKVESVSGSSYHGYKAAELRESIMAPSIDLEAVPVLPPGKGALTLKTRNLGKIHFRLYPVDPDALPDEIKAVEKYYSFYGWASLLGSTNEKWLAKVLGKKPAQRWVSPVADKGDHKPVTTDVDPPALEKGIYLVVAAESDGFRLHDELVSSCFLNVTDFVVVGTPGVTGETLATYNGHVGGSGTSTVDDDVLRLYALDGRSGEPVGGVSAKVWMSYSYQRQSIDTETGDRGVAPVRLSVNVTPAQMSDYGYYYGQTNNFSFDPLARKNGAFSYWKTTQGLSWVAPNPIALFIETDRPIYRPGHKVKAKVIALKKTASGYRTVGQGVDLHIKVYDPNGKDFFTKKLDLNAFGSGDVTFDIPPGRLLGSYRLEASCTDGGFTNRESAYFSVEEYKQPEFEITLEPAKEAWKYGKPVEVKGAATYYFGGPVAGATVTYVIKRRIYVPWYYRYWFGDSFMESDEELVHGTVTTDGKGEFKVAFTPTAPPARPYVEKIPDMAEFVVEVEGRDAGGRTISGSSAYRAGRNAYYFTIEPDKGFLSVDEGGGLEAKLLTINDAPAPGSSAYEVFRLADVPAKTLDELEKGEQPSQGGYGYYGYYGGGWKTVPPLDVQLKDVGNGEKAAGGTVQHDAEGLGRVTLPPLPAGAYRIVLKTKDAWGEEVVQEKLFVVAGKSGEGVPVRAASVTLVEKDEYKVGETARFVLGSDLGSGTYYVEIWAGPYFMKNDLVRGGKPVTVVEVPVDQPLKGGFSFRWFGVKDMAVNHGQAEVSVPWGDKKLAVALGPFEKKLAPGQEATWGVTVKDSASKPASSEVLALMYDRALEYYVTSSNPWMNSLYLPPPGPAEGIDSVFTAQVSSFSVTGGIFEKLRKLFKKVPEPPRAPALRTWNTWARSRGELGIFDSIAQKSDFAMRSAAPGEAPPAPQAAAPMALEEEAAGGKAEGKQAAAKGPMKGMAKPPAAEPRKAFADTAFFQPHIVTSAGGTAKISFKAPEQLTSWKIKLFAFTTDAKEGTLVEEAVTKKDLMVRADLPRFFREKDKGTLTAVVHNESEGAMEGDLEIDITEEGASINEKLKLAERKRRFSLAPHSLAAFNWMIEIPEGVSTYKVRVAAAAGGLHDAEERDLPILPSRQRLIESAFVTLSGKETKTLEIKLKEDPTRINESMTVQIDPQLTLSLLNTIPFLVEYPYTCVEQELNKFVPLAIVNQIYRNYPAIKKATAKIPKRDTITPPWEKDDPRRLITLMETPWVQQSEGLKSPFPLVDLLDPAVVEGEKQIALDYLRSAQHGSGAFPWIPGGEPDVYITLYVLAGFAEAKRYGVQLPEDMVSRALAYVNGEIPSHLDKDERNLATIAYAAYVLTTYSPDEYPEARKGHDLARSWVKFLQKHIHALTPFGKAYLAYTYFHLGDRKKADEVLDMALDGAREDPLVGVYWTMEKYSWVWYSDSVEKHAFFLKMLQELRPTDKRIPGMVQWLLFNRKGNVWKSTKASSAAVYALLDYLNRSGALSSKDVFSLSWGDTKASVTVNPDDWLEEPLRWIETGFDITPAKTTAVVKKDGKGIAFASMTWIYSTDQLPEASAPGLLLLDRAFFRRVKEGDAYHLKPVASGDKVLVGDEVVVQLKVEARSQFEYMHLKDLKAAGFEAETLLSGWTWSPLPAYEEPRDSLTNFFVSWLPQGEYILSYTLRPTKPGTYRIGAATLQSMYAPEMTAHSAGFIINVAEK